MQAHILAMSLPFQCILSSRVCDGYPHCKAGQDEQNCQTLNTLTEQISIDRFPPALVDLDEGGYLRTYSDLVRSWSNGQVQCPETHVECPGNNFCIPVYLRCNGVYDCPEHEDETGCDRHRCPGFYRCRGSTACLHPAHLCDGWAQCPQHDDELLCNLTCPNSCTCYGHAFFCTQPFQAAITPSSAFWRPQRLVWSLLTSPTTSCWCTWVWRSAV